MRASATSGSSAHATARATIGSASRPPARSSAPQRAAWTGSPRASTPRVSSRSTPARSRSVRCRSRWASRGSSRHGRRPDASDPRRRNSARDRPMTDDERRLPANRPGQSTELTTERFSAPPSIRATGGLTPERAAGIVRQSSSARWVGFRTICFVSLFVVLYWFYELGFPLGLSEARLNEEIENQQITAVERGYNIYQANCARCHGPNGLGPNEDDAAEKAAAGQPYIGPELNSQEKLFSHLSEAYIRNVLEVGGRYGCGNPPSAMPIWADTGDPPGPLNYRQIDELVAFLRATNEVTYA